MEPWGPEAPCLPSGFPLPSIKRKYFSRGTAGQGLTTGYVMFAPALGAANNQASVWFSDGNFTAATFNLSGVGVNTAQSNSNFVIGSFGANLMQYRVVSAGIRVRYTGTELNRGGRVIPFEHPSHGTVFGFGVSTLLSMQGTEPVRPSSDGKWITAVYSGPKEEIELAYSSDFTGINSGNPLVIAFTGGVPPTGTSPSATANFLLEWECWANYEFIGVALSGQTPSHHDPVGASLAANAVNAAQQTHPHSNTPGFKSDVMSSIEKFGREAVTTIWNNRDTIMDVGKAAAGLLL